MLFYCWHYCLTCPLPVYDDLGLSFSLLNDFDPVMLPLLNEFSTLFYFPFEG